MLWLYCQLFICIGLCRTLAFCGERINEGQKKLLLALQASLTSIRLTNRWSGSAAWAIAGCSPVRGLADGAGSSKMSCGSMPQKAELCKNLTPQQYHVTQEGGTERWSIHSKSIFYFFLDIALCMGIPVLTKMSDYLFSQYQFILLLFTFLLFPSIFCGIFALY